MGRSRAARTAADLTAAAALIVEHGWLDRGGGSCSTGFCANDAIAHVVRSDVKRHREAMAALAAHVNPGHRITASRLPERAVILWNDLHACSADVVVDAMHTTAAALR